MSNLCKQEDVVEAQRLVGEISDFYEELQQGEKTFISQMSERFEQFGEKTYVTKPQFDWIKDIYERVIG